MAYRLKRKESIAAGVKRIAREELGSAIQHVSGRGGVSRDEAVHEARKCIKKARALLLLVRGELGDAYDVEIARLREVGQKLSRLRDAGALVTTLDELRRRYPKQLGRRSLGSIRRALTAHKKHLEAEMATGQAMTGLAGTLQQSRKAIPHWPVKHNGFSAIAGGFEKSFRRGRKLLARVRRRARSEELHEWRKRVKDHWYHVRLLENLWTDVMKGYEHTLKDLETALGEDHNLSLLRAQIASAPETFGNARDVKLVRSAIDEYQKELRDSALSLGKRVYASKPRRLVREMRDLWNAWHEK